MADFLSIGVSGLLAYQNALTTTGHNISNVNTPGYSRQRTDLTTRIPEPSGAGYLGNGVQVVNVRRMYDQFSVDQVRTHTAQNSRLDTLHTLAMEVDNLLADPDAGLDPVLQNFFNALQGVADNPSSVPARQVLLSEADSMVERFQSIDDRLNALRDKVNGRLDSLTAQINALATSLAKVNYDIVISGSKADGQPANDLLDQRDELLRQLAELVPVTTVDQDNGATNVFIGNGQVLVLGADAREISTARDPYNPYRMEVVAGANGTGPIISDYITGGQLGGVLEFRAQVLEPAQNALGRVAIGIAMAVNDQQALGLDMNDAVGSQFFNLSGLSGNAKTALPSSLNTGTANATFTFDDASKITTSDYELFTADGLTYTVTRLSDSTTVGTFTPGAYPATYAVASEGFSITLDAAALGGDSYKLDLTRTAATDLALNLTNAKQIAAAGPLRSQLSSGNLGDATISVPTTLDITNAAFFTTIDIRMSASIPGGAVDQYEYSSDGGATWSAPVAYTSGGNIDLNGWRVQVTGTPLDGDQFSVAKNTNAVSDNRNALALAALQQAGVLDAGSNSIQTAYGQMVSEVGVRTHQMSINSQAQKTILDQAIAVREGVSGVNLDEEAANMLRFQQAYQASAQLINAANTLFQTLLDTVRR